MSPLPFLEPLPDMKFLLLFFFGCIFFFSGCSRRQSDTPEVVYTKADSVTERYLAFQDSLVKCWHEMINDDNHKIKAMNNLLHELMVTHPEERESLEILEERLEQLTRMRYTQNSIANPDVVAEYDFASNSLVNELIILAESKSEFAYNTTLQRLVDHIRAADQRVELYRLDYDSIAMAYNRFMEFNQPLLQETDLTVDKKPLFQMIAEE